MLFIYRYAEDDCADELNKIPADRGEFVQDTLKTYCTEGTPYETPFFSNATSMSDLRQDVEQNDTEKFFIDNDKYTTKNPKVSQLDEKDHCSVEDISEMEKSKPQEKLKSEFSSGIMSPEKPVNYCEEGTPGYFSRVSSFGSLNSIPCTPKEKSVKPEASKPNSASKIVTKSTTCTAEQTPLMFSRSSSLASLNSVEQHSIHDDQSSIVSDFSRLASGVISPSEIPDSPTQSVSPSPQPRKGRIAGLRRPQPTPRNLKSVFEDNVTKFKEESTPVQFSTATSLSSLITEDNFETENINVIPHEERASVMASGASASTEDDGKEKQDMEKSKSNVHEEESEISENENDDDILANCINIGMQSKSQYQGQGPSKSFLPKYQPQTPPTKGHHASNSKSYLDNDCIRPYCTEDTPADLSHACSNTDLSVLSINDSKSKKDYFSDDSSNLSGDNENILERCIQSGMPKPKKQIPVYKDMQSGPSRKSVEKSPNVATKDLRSYKYVDLAKDEVASYAVENSPCLFSLRSSLSDLTMEDGSRSKW